MRILASIAAVACGVAMSFAVPAKPTPITYTQPDGTEITVQLRGDERSHFYLSEDGYLLVNVNDAFHYGNIDAAGQIVASDMLAKPKAMRTSADMQYLQHVDMDRVFDALESRAALAPARSISGNDRKPRLMAANAEDEGQHSPTWGVGLFPGTHFPAMGEQKGLVVLVEYTDVTFNLDDPYDYWYRALNEDGFSDYGGTGSARQYWIDQSLGQFTPQFDVYGPITLAHNQAYYGGNDWWGNDQNPEKMAIEACQQLDATVDFTEYDRDNDGYIDNIFVIYAGRGEASGGSSNTVWPHSWEVSSATSTPYYFDGVRLDHYACSNDWEGSKPDGIGTFVHEFSHVMGLPDLYATSYTNAFTPDRWSVMDRGSYNNDSRTPPNYGIYERNCFKWIEPTVLPNTYSATLNPIAENEGFVIESGKSTEFFLLENRQKTGWDAYIPGHGMLVWHIDYNASVWNNNTVNNSESHQYVDIEEADNTRNESSRAGDAFPGTANKTMFTAETTPAMKTWSNTPLDFPIINIKEQGGVITFKVGGGPIEPPAAVEAYEVAPEDIGKTSFVASWSSSADATSYRVSVEDSEGNYPGTWKLRDVGDRNRIRVEGLQPATTYKYTVWAVKDGAASDPSNVVEVTTLDPTIDYFTMVALDATEVTPESFVANWEGLDLATEYFIDVVKEIPTDAWQESVDFTGGLKNMPEGWTTTSVFVYTNPEYSGESAPSLRFASAGYITSPTYDEDVVELSFWHKGINVYPENTVVVKAMVNNRWEDVESFSADTEGSTESLLLPDGTRSVRIEYVEATHRGSIAVDDIVLTIGGRSSVRIPLEQYTGASAGSELSMVIEGLEPSTIYYYSVIATDGELNSKRSQEIMVVTQEGSGIKAVETAAAGISVHDRQITLGAEGGIYTLEGIAVYHGAAATVDVAPGVYIVKSGTKTLKVTIK